MLTLDGSVNMLARRQSIHIDEGLLFGVLLIDNCADPLPKTRLEQTVGSLNSPVNQTPV